MILHFESELNPNVEISINNRCIFTGNAQDVFTVDCTHKKGTLRVTMYGKDPRDQPSGKDKHIKLTHIEFEELVLDEQEIYKLYDPCVNNTKTLYLGFNTPEKLEINIEHPYNKLIKNLLS